MICENILSSATTLLLLPKVKDSSLPNPNYFKKKKQRSRQLSTKSLLVPLSPLVRAPLPAAPWGWAAGNNTLPSRLPLGQLTRSSRSLPRTSIFPVPVICLSCQAAPNKGHKGDEGSSWNSSPTKLIWCVASLALGPHRRQELTWLWTGYK